MQIFTLIRPIVAFSALLVFPFAMYAQETKKEVHIKIVEDGVVTKDTVYNITGEFPEIEHYTEMQAHHGTMKGRHMKERQVIIMEDSAMEDAEWVQEGDNTKEVQKEVRVIVSSGEGEDESSDVEEIWIGGHGEGKPCRTIIIHEGDCPGGHLEMKPMMPPPPHEGGPVKHEKKVIKTDKGEKVIIVETNEDEQPKAKEKR
jgi:hypothetical protein